MTLPIRIVVADDHPIVRDGLIAILSTQADFAVVGEAANGAEVVAVTLRLQPDILLLDLAMPSMDGVTALETLVKEGSHARAIIFTAFDTDERILAAVRAGAPCYLLKGTPREEIFQAIRIVAQGGSLLTPIVATKLLRQVRMRDRGPEDLTPREQEILQHVARGRQNKEIARDLAITERTVKFHVAALMRKLGAGNRTELTSLAAQRGLVQFAD